MFEKLLFSIGVFTNIAPFAVLCYLPFMDHLRISKKKLFISFLLITIAQFIICFSFHWLPFDLVQILFFVVFVLCFVLYLLTIRMNFSKLLFVFLVIANYAAFTVGITNFLTEKFFFNYPNVSKYSIPSIVILMAVLAVSVPFVLAILYKRIKPLLNSENIKAWNTLWIIPLMFLLSFILFTGANDDSLMESWQYITVTLTMAIGAFVVYYLVIKMLFETDENATLRENARMVNIQLVLQEDEYKHLSERIFEAKTARHDLRHHLSIMEAYLQSNNISALQDYLNEYKGTLPDETELAICENYTANIIVLHYTGLAKSEGISVSTRLQLPQEIGITGADLCIIFGNCLENALEACRRMISERKYIAVRSELHGNMLGITIDNSFDGTIAENGGIFFSRKRNNEEGVGLCSVRAVAAKYNGVARFTFDENEFQASIILNTQN